MLLRTGISSNGTAGNISLDVGAVARGRGGGIRLSAGATSDPLARAGQVLIESGGRGSAVGAWGVSGPIAVRTSAVRLGETGTLDMYTGDVMEESAAPAATDGTRNRSASGSLTLRTGAVGDKLGGTRGP